MCFEGLKLGFPYSAVNIVSLSVHVIILTNTMQDQKCGPADPVSVVHKGYPGPQPWNMRVFRLWPNVVVKGNVGHNLSQDDKVELILCEGHALIPDILVVLLIKVSEAWLSLVVLAPTPLCQKKF